MISQRTFEGTMDMDNGEGTDYGSGELAGWRGAQQEKVRQL